MSIGHFTPQGFEQTSYNNNEHDGHFFRSEPDNNTCNVLKHDYLTSYILETLSTTIYEYLRVSNEGHYSPMLVSSLVMVTSFSRTNKIYEYIQDMEDVYVN